MANLIRTSRAWFQESIVGPFGTRFNTGNKPNKDAFKRLFDSFLNPLEVSDTAKETTAGHVKTAADQKSFDRSLQDPTLAVDGTEPEVDTLVVPVGYHTTTVLPHQLPGLEVSDGTEATTENTAVVDGGISITAIKKTIGSYFRKNFRIALNLGGSLKIVAKKLQLDGDADSPANGTYYGKNGGNKGWFSLPTFGFPSMTGNSGKFLTNDGTNVMWGTPPTGGGGSSMLSPTDNLSIIYNSSGQLATKPYTLVNPLNQPYPFNVAIVKTTDSQGSGLHIPIDVSTLQWKNGKLGVKVGEIIQDRLVRSDEFLDGISSSTWDHVSAIVAEDYINGGVVLATQSASLTELFSKFETSPDNSPVFEAIFRIKKELLAVGANVPGIKIGFRGDGSSVVKGDFIGMTLSTDNKWVPLLTINGVTTSITSYPVDYVAGDTNHKLKIAVMSDKSAEIYFNDVILGVADAGVVNFNSTQKLLFSLTQVSPYESAIIIDAASLIFDRSEEAYDPVLP